MAATPGPLRKSDVFEGAILWLDRNADIADNITYRRSDLTEGALDHPALVVATLGDNHDYLWICTGTGTSNRNAGDFPLAFSSVDGSTREARFCTECKKTHVYDFANPIDMLHHETCTAKMCKPTHFRLTEVYEVSMRMVRLERSCHSVSDWTIDYASLSPALEQSARDRGRLAGSSHALRNWPLPPVIDFSQPDPPYPGSDFNPDAGTYSGFWEGKDADQGVVETSPGGLNPTIDGSTDTKTLSGDPAVVDSMAATPQAIEPAQFNTESSRPATASPASGVSNHTPTFGVNTTSAKPKAPMPESSKAGRSQASSSKPVIDGSTSASHVEPPVTMGKASFASETAQNKPNDSDGVFTKMGSLLRILSASRKTRRPSLRLCQSLSPSTYTSLPVQR